MAPLLEAISYAVPLTYASTRSPGRRPGGASVHAAGSMGVVIRVTLLALGLGALALRRRTP